MMSRAPYMTQKGNDMKSLQWISMMTLVASVTVVYAADVTPEASSRDAMQQVEADYKNAKEQCRQAKDKKHCLDEAKHAYDQARGKVKTNAANGKGSRDAGAQGGVDAQ